MIDNNWSKPTPEVYKVGGGGWSLGLPKIELEILPLPNPKERWAGTRRHSGFGNNGHLQSKATKLCPAYCHYNMIIGDPKE